MCIFCPLSLDLWHEILKTQNEANERVQGSTLWDLEQCFKHGEQANFRCCDVWALDLLPTGGIRGVGGAPDAAWRFSRPA